MVLPKRTLLVGKIESCGLLNKMLSHECSINFCHAAKSRAPDGVLGKRARNWSMVDSLEEDLVASTGAAFDLPRIGAIICVTRKIAADLPRIPNFNFTELPFFRKCWGHFC